MGEFKPRTVCILGRQPALGLAELESLYGANHVKPLEGAALLDVPAEEINFKRLGGTVKTARILSVLPYTDWSKLTKYLLANVPRHLQHVPSGKFTLGLSTYNLGVNPFDINRTTLAVKKIAKKTGRPMRVVPNKTPTLNSAQVLHNKLTHKGAWELIFIAAGRRTLLAQTLFVQDIEAYAARDQVRPKRDAKVGILPPKLAQIIINLAVDKNIKLRAQSSDNTSEIQDLRSKIRLLDPFCGSGVILQEALLMGYSVMGTDIDQRMTEYAKANIKWLFQKYPQIQGHVVIEVADATKYQWPRFTALVSEVYLGQALSSFPSAEKMRQIVYDTNTIIKKFLNNLAPQLKPNHRLCLAVPAWQKPSGEFVHLPLIDKLTDMGYNRFSFSHVRHSDMIYIREGQIVGRELLVLSKS